MWACANVLEACASIRRYLRFHNDWRPHSSLDGTPQSGLLQRADARSGGSVNEAESHLGTPRSCSSKPSELFGARVSCH
jgi:hypothetical protein